MPTSVTATNGEVFHLWQLHEESAKEVTLGVEFNEIRNDLGNGYRTQILYGADTGTRTWNITLPTLAGSDVAVPTVSGINGSDVSREQYLWDLYCDTRITGKPFAFTCPKDGQYYLVDFVNKSLSYEKQFRVDLYSTGIQLMQVREAGVTIFDLDGYVARSSASIAHARETGHSSPNWVDTTSGGNAFVAGGTVTFGANPQNGHNTVRLNGTSGYLSGGWSGAVYDVIVAMQVRSTTFASNSGFLAKSTSSDIIKGTSGGTKWQNPSITSFEYTLNGVAYENTDLQAPMNTWGVCHFRTDDPNYMDLSSSPILGRSISSAFGAYDIGEILVAYGGPIPKSDTRQIIEHLCIKWL